ncbi:phage tail protein [Salmonella enterica]|nr:phage tail protein [Salmonella enterica]
MLKMNSLRDTLTRASRWCKANPDKFTVFVESGHIETTGATASFAYRFNLVFFAMDFPGHIDELTLPLMGWLYLNQPSLLLNPEKNKDVKFSVAINDDDSADILFEMPVLERVKVTLDKDGIPRAEHLPEPRPRLPPEDGEWGVVFTDMTWRDDA